MPVAWTAARSLPVWRKRDKTFRIGTPMRKVSWKVRFAAEDRHFGESGYEDG
jgi:hypothetical protein